MPEPTAKPERLLRPTAAELTPQHPLDLPTVRIGRVRIKCDSMLDNPDDDDVECPQCCEPGGARVVAERE